MSEPAATGERAGRVQPIQDLAEGTGAAFEVGPDGVWLVGARSASSGVPCFPARPVCPATGARDMEPARFGPGGTLYSFSTVRVSATRPVPYTIGYLDLPQGLRVLARIEARGVPLACDMAMALRGADGAWWAEPAEAGE